MTTTIDANGISTLRMVVYAAAVFAVAAVIRLANIDHLPITDELYHLLAAESWVTDGRLAIADGEYRRASVFTRLVGMVLMAGDGSPVSVRIFGALVGALLVAVVFAWARRTCNLTVALSSAALLAILPNAIFLSQHIRFYALHALVFFLITWLVFAVVTQKLGGKKLLLAIAAIVILIALGMNLQVTTAVGLAGMALWVVLFHWEWVLSRLPRGTKSVLVGIGVVGVVAIVAVLAREQIVGLVSFYQSSAMWNSADDPLYYFRLFNEQLGALWSLFPAAVVVALVARPVPAGLCVSVFAVAFVVQSFGGMRAERFMFYAMPFMMITLGIAFDVVARALVRMVRDALEGAPWSRFPEAGRKALAMLLVAGASAFVLVTTPAVEMGARMVLGKKLNPPLYWDRYHTDWEAATPKLSQLSANADVTISSQPLQAIYYLGDVDFALNATMLADAEALGATGGLDPRMGRVIIADADSMMQVLACNNSGVIIAHKPAWRNESRITGATADLIEAHTDPNPIAEPHGLLVFEWSVIPEDLVCGSR